MAEHIHVERTASSLTAYIIAMHGGEEITITVIYTREKALSLLKQLAERDTPAALDFETTALNPKSGKVRLSSISFSNNEVYILDHEYCGSFSTLAKHLDASAPHYVFNSKFENHWFLHEDIDAYSYDVGHMRRSVLGGGPLSLVSQVKRDLGIEIDKEQQLSDWGAKVLSTDQLIYAGLDAIYTYRLGEYWRAEMTEGHWNGFHIINDATNAFIEMENTGLILDVAYHETLITMWEKRRAAAERVIRKYASEEALPNIRSKKQLSNLLKRGFDAASINAWPKTAATEQLSTTRDTLRQAAFRSPYPMSRFLAALMVFTRADKYLSTYGKTLITKQTLGSGRIYGRLNIAQAITGRVSSSSPNMQNFPHSLQFRRSFIAARGRKLIIADYSSIEIRVLAELSGDEVLLYDCVYGNVHAQSAIAIYKLDEKSYLKALKNGDPVAKAMRTNAKSFTFQLLYGAGASALSIVLRTDKAGAEQAVDAWATRYPKAYHYRQHIFEIMNHTGFVPVHSGRTIYVHKQDRTIPVAANYGVQGAAGDVMYSACTEVHAGLCERDNLARMQVTVHDELLLDSPEEYADEAKIILEEGMVRGWLNVFPGTNTDNLVEATIGDTWADKT